MKTFRMLFLSAATLMLAVSCLEENDPYNAGFFFRKPTSVVTAIYANSQGDSVSFFSYGNWAVNQEAAGGSWCSVGTTSGHGNTWYTFHVTFEQNTTGEGRGVRFNFTDTDHPSEASAAIVYWQYATRGDGTLGNAPDVKTISGTDGSEFVFTYDVLHRPTSLRINRGGTLLRSLSLSYNDRDSLLTVMDGSKTLVSMNYDRDFQPLVLRGSTDTISYETQYYSNGYPMTANNAFNLVHRTLTGQNTYYALLLGGQSLQPDSLHRADSLRIATIGSDNVANVKKWKLVYSQDDNRRQSVDVNQLIFGTEQCDPYQLLSLFRYTRNTSIVSEAIGENERISVSTVLNADRSVKTLHVSSQNGGITYTFDY